MKWRKIGLFLTVTFLSLLVGTVFLFRWSAAQIKASCQPQGSLEAVLSTVDTFNSDLSPYKQLVLSEDDISLLLRQSLSPSSCSTIQQNLLVITIPGTWLAYILHLQPLAQEPFWRISRFEINGLRMPAALTERYNQQIHKAWRDFSYDLAAKRIITNITIEDRKMTIDGEIPPSR